MSQTSYPPVVSAILSQAPNQDVALSMLEGSYLESGWSSTAQNSIGATGPFQILLPVHPNVSYAQATNPQIATQLMLGGAITGGYISAVNQVGSAAFSSNPEQAAEEAAAIAEQGGSYYATEGTAAVNAAYQAASAAMGGYGAAGPGGTAPGSNIGPATSAGSTSSGSSGSSPSGAPSGFFVALNNILKGGKVSILSPVSSVKHVALMVVARLSIAVLGLVVIGLGLALIVGTEVLGQLRKHPEAAAAAVAA